MGADGIGLDQLTFGGLEMEPVQLGNRWLAKLTAGGIARERLVIENGERHVVVMTANARRTRQIGERLCKLADALEALDADDTERLSHILETLNDEEGEPDGH